MHLRLEPCVAGQEAVRRPILRRSGQPGGAVGRWQARRGRPARLGRRGLEGGAGGAGGARCARPWPPRVLTPARRRRAGARRTAATRAEKERCLCITRAGRRSRWYTVRGGSHSSGDLPTVKRALPGQRTHSAISCARSMRMAPVLCIEYRASTCELLVTVCAYCICACHN